MVCGACGKERREATHSRESMQAKYATNLANYKIYYIQLSPFSKSTHSFCPPHHIHHQVLRLVVPAPMFMPKSRKPSLIFPITILSLFSIATILRGFLSTTAISRLKSRISRRLWVHTGRVSNRRLVRRSRRSSDDSHKARRSSGAVRSRRWRSCVRG